MSPGLTEHPTVKWFHGRAPEVAEPQETRPVDAAWLRRLSLEAGADDVGFVSIERPEVGEQRADILAVFPATRALISFVCRMNREPIRSPARWPTWSFTGRAIASTTWAIGSWRCWSSGGCGP